MSDIAWLTEHPIAHRGFHDLNILRWENTLSAFEAAATHGFAIECDVHLAADGVPVVFHDDTLDRLTGNPGHVWETTSDDLSGMTIGRTQDRIPTLDAVLERVAGRVPIVIELKGIAGHDDGLVSAVARRLDVYRGPAGIMSFDHWLVRGFARHAPGIPCGLTAHGRTTADLEAHFSMLAHPISFVSFGLMDLPNPFVTFARQRLAMPVITWTVRDEWGCRVTSQHADQMTFEGFDPSGAKI